MLGAAGRHRWRGILFASAAAALALGAVAVEGTAPDPGDGGDGAPPAPAVAHLWIDRDGGTCTRTDGREAYDPAAACAGLGEAYAAANAVAAPSTVLIKGGRYGPQTISGDRARGGRVTFDEAPEEDATFGGLVTLGVGPDGTGPAAGPDRITLRNITTGTFGRRYANPRNRFGIYLLPGTSSVRLEDATQGGFLVQGATDVEFVGGSFGPCRAAPIGADNPCELNKVDHAPCTPACPPQRIVVDGVDFHGYDYGDDCVVQGETGTDGCHHRAMYVNGVHGFTLRNSTFRDSVFAPWTTHSGPEAGAAGSRDILIENNQFGARAMYRAGSYAEEAAALQFGWCQNTVQPAYRDVTVRFNSFAAGATVDVPGLAPEEHGCSVEGFEVYGNVLGAAPACGLEGVSWHHNVTLGAAPGGCGPGDAGTASAGFYRRDTPAPRPGDYALGGPAAAPDDLVPSSAGCPATDAAGRRRGSGGRCDAGAFERP